MKRLNLWFMWIAGVLVVISAGSFLAFFVATSPVAEEPAELAKTSLEPTVNPEAPVLTVRGRHVTVMSWNLSFGYGPRASASHPPRPSRAALDQRLESLAAFLKNNGADILLLQNLDFRSDRSHRVDQFDTLMRAGNYAYGVRAVSWSRRFVPLPLKPWGQWLGQVVAGGAILSRYPICGHLVNEYPGRKEKDFLDSAFRHQRFSQRARICAGDSQFFVINSVFEASTPEEHEKESASIERFVVDSREEAPVLAVGGTLQGPTAGHHAAIRPPQHLIDIFAKGAPGLPSELTRTYPTVNPTSRPDFLFIDDRVRLGNAAVMHLAGTMSDHYPVHAELSW